MHVPCHELLTAKRRRKIASRYLLLKRNSNHFYCVSSTGDFTLQPERNKKNFCLCNLDCSFIVRRVEAIKFPINLNTSQQTNCF